MLVRATSPIRWSAGTKFYERAEIKDAIQYLTFLVNPQDATAFTRIANSPRRGLGQTSLSRVLALADAKGISVWEAAEGEIPGLETAARKALGRFMETMRGLRERVEGGAPVAQLLDELLDKTGYRDALQAERTIEAQGRLENLEELVAAAPRVRRQRGRGRRSLGEFLQQSLAGGRRGHDARRRGPRDADDDAQRQGPRVPDRVHDRDGGRRFPHSRSIEENQIEEERRLAYVGLTRAMRDLTLTFARRRNTYGGGVAAHSMRSRFLDELPARADRPGGAVARGLPGAGAGRVVVGGGRGIR